MVDISFEAESEPRLDPLSGQDLKFKPGQKPESILEPEQKDSNESELPKSMDDTVEDIDHEKAAENVGLEILKLILI